MFIMPNLLTSTSKPVEKLNGLGLVGLACLTLIFPGNSIQTHHISIRPPKYFYTCTTPSYRTPLSYNSPITRAPKRKPQAIYNFPWSPQKPKLFRQNPIVLHAPESEKFQQNSIVVHAPEAKKKFIEIVKKKS